MRYAALLTLRSGFANDLLVENNTASRSKTQHGIYVSNSGDRPIIRNNTISDSAGFGLKIASEDKFDKGGNVFENNRMAGAVIALELDTDLPQGKMCGNTVAAQALVAEDEPLTDLSKPC